MFEPLKFQYPAFDRKSLKLPASFLFCTYRKPFSSSHLLVLNFPRVRCFSIVKWPEDDFLPRMSLNFIELVILRPTWGNNMLDLCFTNNVDRIHNVKVTPIANSHHNIVELSIVLGELLVSTLLGKFRPYPT